MKWIIFIVFCIFAWCFSCVHGYLPVTEVVIPEGDPIDTAQVAVPDSCTPTPIVTPSFRKAYFQDFGMIDDSIIITAGLNGQRHTWINDFQIVESHTDIIRDIVDEYINFDTMLILDKTTIETGVISIQFALLFIRPEGSWTTIPDIYFEFGSRRGLLWEKNPRSVYLADLPTGMDSALISTMKQIPQYAKFGCRGYVTDSIGYDNLLGVLLDSCKCCATIDWRDLPISQDRIDQCDYQNIILIL